MALKHNKAKRYSSVSELNIIDATNAVTVSNVAIPTITEEAVELLSSPLELSVFEPLATKVAGVLARLS